VTAKRIVPCINWSDSAREMLSQATRMAEEGADEVLLLVGEEALPQTVKDAVREIASGSDIALIVWSANVELLDVGADRIVIPESDSRLLESISGRYGASRVASLFDTQSGSPVQNRLFEMRESGAGEIVLPQTFVKAMEQKGESFWDIWNLVSLPLAIHVTEPTVEVCIDLLSSGADAIYLDGSLASSSGALSSLKSRLAEAGLSVRI
jgi:imidazole glycerol phosphate synthase subunit HisF